MVNFFSRNRILVIGIAGICVLGIAVFFICRSMKPKEEYSVSSTNRISHAEKALFDGSYLLSDLVDDESVTLDIIVTNDNQRDVSYSLLILVNEQQEQFDSGNGSVDHFEFEFT